MKSMVWAIAKVTSTLELSFADCSPILMPWSLRSGFYNPGWSFRVGTGWSPVVGCNHWKDVLAGSSTPKRENREDAVAIRPVQCAILGDDRRRSNEHLHDSNAWFHCAPRHEDLEAPPFSSAPTCSARVEFDRTDPARISRDCRLCGNPACRPSSNRARW